MYYKTMLSILAKSLIISFQYNIESVYFFYSNPVILVGVSSNFVSTYSLLTDSRAVCVVFFFSKLLFTKSNYGEKYLGLTTSSDGSSMRRFSNGIHHHRWSIGIIHITVLPPCWWRQLKSTKLFFHRNIWNACQSDITFFSIYSPPKCLMRVLCVNSLPSRSYIHVIPITAKGFNCPNNTSDLLFYSTIFYYATS